MHWWVYIAIPAFGLYAAFKLLYSISVALASRRRQRDESKSVSVLVAARDEEENILRCLNSLARQKYAPERFEVWVGDDDSSDNTANLVLEFCRAHPQFHYFKVTEKLPGQQGKQNVLAHLAHKAKGEVLLITDADIALHPDWAATLAGSLQPGVGMVSGPTLVEGSGFFSKLQGLDWLMGMAINAAHSILGIPLTASGNNSAILREAYDSIGGYEALSFSITEDYLLFQELCEKRNWKFRMLFCPEAFGSSAPIKDLATLFKQRKRWFKGGSSLAWYNMSLILFNSMVLPILFVGLFFLPWQLCLGLYGIKVLSDVQFLLVSSLALKKPALLAWFLPWEIYYNLVAVIGPLNQLLPGKVEWKGREY